MTLLLTFIFGAAGIAMLGDGFADAATFGFASGSLLEVVVAFTALANAALFVLNMVPGVPARRRPDRARDRVEADRQPPRGDEASPPTWARASRR